MVDLGINNFFYLSILTYGNRLYIGLCEESMEGGRYVDILLIGSF